MRCPKCDYLPVEGETRVINSRPRDGSIYRRRRCPKCLHRFSTTETVAFKKSKNIILTIKVAAQVPKNINIKDISIDLPLKDVVLFDIDEAGFLRKVNSHIPSGGYTISSVELDKLD